MTLELNHTPPPKDTATPKPDVTEHKPVAPEQPSPMHEETHSAEALTHHKQFHLHAEKHSHGHSHKLHHVELDDHEIKHDGSAQTYHIKPGDTLSEISRRQLPPGASMRDVYNHVKEIARANGIIDSDKISPNMPPLKLPEFAPHPEVHHHVPGRPISGGDAPPVVPPHGGDQPAKPPVPGDDQHTVPPKAGDQPPAKAGDQPPAKAADAPDHHDAPAETDAQAKDRRTAIADQIQAALGDDNPPIPPSMGDGIPVATGPITNVDKLKLELNQSPEDLKAISDIFAQKYGAEHGGRTLEAIAEDRTSGTDKSQVTDFFHRSSKADDPGRVHTAMEEMHQFWGGRSKATCEKDIRDTLATMNSTQIDAFKQEYETRYGTKFDDAIANDSKMTPETKAALAIYEKGSDHRSTQDTLGLADLATQAKNLDMFQEAFRGASPEARTQYMAQGGDDKMKEAFSGIFSDKDLVQARDYVKEGKLDTSTKVSENAGIFSSNGDAIDTAVKAMSQGERDQYDRGKALSATFPEYIHQGRSATFNSDAYNKLTDDQKQDYDKYRTLHDSFEKAGNEAKVTRWEDMVAHGSETLVTTLAQHGGLFGADKIDKPLAEIEGMSKTDFDRFKQDPNYRKEVDAALALNYSGDDLKRAEQLLDTKLAHASYEQGGATDGTRSILQSIKDKDGTWSTDTKGILSAVENLSPAEQQRYRTDTQFKKDLDKAVNDSLDGTEQYAAATRALERVANGQSPHEDVIDKLNSHLEDGGDTKTMLAEIQTAMKDDPGLRDRLNNPKTDADKAFAAEFKEKAQENFGSDYEKLVEPLVQTGFVPFSETAQLYKGFFSNDTKGLYEAIAAASPADQQAIAAHPEQTLSYLTPEQQQLAGIIAGQKGQLKPEDQMRAAILGESGDKDAIKDLGTSLKPEERAQLAHDYEVKYHSPLVADLDDKLTGQAKIEAERDFRDMPTSAREAFNNARDEEYQSNDGIGKAFVRNAWDGTSDMSTDDLNQYAAAMEGYSKVYKDMPVTQSDQMAGDMTKAVDLYRKSKGAAADAVVDGAIIVVGVGGAAFTGGVSLSLIATTGLAGAAFKIGTKAAIEGADYDTSKMATDGLTGAIDAATMVVGPGEVAGILKIGGKAATTASELAIAEAGTFAQATGKQLLKEGAEATLSKELTKDVSTALAHGAKEIDAKTMQSLAEKYAANPSDVPAVKELLTKSLNQAIATESGNALKSTLREVALNSGAGAAAGGTSSAVRGATEWDSGKSVSENLQAIGEQTLMGAGSGLIMGGGATVGFKALGKGFAAAREAVAEHMGSTAETHLIPLQDMLPKPDNVLLDKNGRISMIHGTDGVGTTSVEYHESGPLQGRPSSVAMADGTRYENLADNKLRVSDPTNPEGVIVTGDVQVAGNGEVIVNAANGDKQTFHFDGTSTLQVKATGDSVVLGRYSEVLAVKANGGHVVEFGYGEGGNFEGAQYQNGRSVLSEDGGKTWSIKESKDAPAVQFDGQVTVDDLGAVHLKPADAAAPERVLRPDGSSSHIDPASGKPSDITLPNGKVQTFKYGADGSISEYTDLEGLRWVADNTGKHPAYNNIDASGDVVATSSRQMQVTADGTVIEAHHYQTKEIHSDGRELTIDNWNKKPLKETVPEGYARDGMTKGADGRPLAHYEDRTTYAREHFSDRSASGNAVRSVEGDLRDVKAIGADGKPTSAYDSLLKDPTLNDAQKDNILRNLAVVREHFANFRAGDRMHPDPEINWIHTQGEMAKVLEVGRAKKLSPTELEDSLLASMYSDAVKFASPAPRGASSNFFTHHLDGILAAQESLSKQGFPADRIARITEAIDAHQIAPPQLMGQLYYAQINARLEAAIKVGSFSPEEGAQLRDVLKGMSEVGADGKTRIKFIADVNNAPKVMGADGHLQVALTPEEQRLMSFAGVDHWSVPYDPKLDPNFRQMTRAEQAEALSRQKIAQTLIDGDGVDNYATSGGASKIVGIRGPGTYFPDSRVWKSLDSVDDSFKDAYAVMSPEARSIADANLVARKELTNADSGPIKTQMDDWLRSQGRDPSQPIPYYNTDLKYPTSDQVIPGEKNLPGLNDQEMKDYQFAKKIRQEMVDLLRQNHRVEGDLPGNFEDSLGRVWGQKFGSHEPEALTLPLTKAEDIKPGETFTSADKKLVAHRNPEDGSLLVTDFKDNSIRHYDSQNRLLDSSVAGQKREFSYDTEGKISGITTTSESNGEKAILSRTEDGKGWTEKQIGADGKVKAETTREESEVVVDADGTVKNYYKGEYGNERFDRYNPDGSVDTVRPSGRVDYVRANYGLEKQGLDNAIAHSLAGDPQRLARVQELIQGFEKNADGADRNLSENDKALFYKQINRLLSDSPTAALPLTERVNLAEQVLNHAKDPSSVDQGSNGTCNVTTLEHRNYWRDPDKNAQVIADVALTGHYQFADGTKVDLNNISGELKPDFEAKRNLDRQVASGAGDGIKGDGERDYSSQLLESAMVNYRWAKNTEVITADGRILKPADITTRYDGQGKPIGVVDNQHLTELKDKDGLPITDYKPGDEVYDQYKKPIKDVPQDRMLYDNLRRPVGFVDKMSNVHQAYGADGKPFEGHGYMNAGDKVFDEHGKLMFMDTRPGDLHYEKVPVGPGDIDKERVYVEINGKKMLLKDNHGDPVDAPGIPTSELRNISDQVTGFEDEPFIIGGDGLGEVHVKSKEELVQALTKLDEDHNLPAVMLVNASKPPFGHNNPTFDKDGRFADWHVINVHGIQHVKDPITGEDKVLIRFTNQWGSKADHLETGLDADTMFEALQPTPDQPKPVPKPPRSTLRN